MTCPSHKCHVSSWNEAHGAREIHCSISLEALEHTLQQRTYSNIKKSHPVSSVACGCAHPGATELARRAAGLQRAACPLPRADRPCPVAASLDPREGDQALGGQGPMGYERGAVHSSVVVPERRVPWMGRGGRQTWAADPVRCDGAPCP